MIGGILAFTPSVLYAYKTSNPTTAEQLKLLTIFISSIGMAAVAYRAIHVAETRSATLGVAYALFLIILSYTLIQLVLEAMVKRYCQGCPPPGLMSMALVAILCLAIVDAIVYYMLV